MQHGPFWQCVGVSLGYPGLCETCRLQPYSILVLSPVLMGR